ncbi:hypothetical protein F2P79_005530 [Pimephales promelas]|nr:hypothetical protein F2P79_005530 [Pimephales promelas]KAG1961414.1 hypothetical protein F2P79_005530 [Pimephales promelas]KAG1961415.1 hypothetical protein F2P79_005530 [Pimephales promelas]KAG1961416.1 hypothetical protein F2P79_005530 [Pimephales promelas]
MSLDIVLINNPSILSCYSCPLTAVRVVGHSALLLRVFWLPFLKSSGFQDSEKILSTGSLKYVPGGPVNGGEMRVPLLHRLLKLFILGKWRIKTPNDLIEDNEESTPVLLTTSEVRSQEPVIKAVFDPSVPFLHPVSRAICGLLIQCISDEPVAEPLTQAAALLTDVDLFVFAHLHQQLFGPHDGGTTCRPTLEPLTQQTALVCKTNEQTDNRNGVMKE